MKLRINKFIFLSILAIFFGLPLNAILAETTIEKLQSTINSIDAFQAEFNQEAYNHISQKSTKATGTVYFKSPNLMRWEYENPNEQLIIIGNETIWYYDPILENVSVQSRKDFVDSLAFDFFSEQQLKKKFQEIKTITLDLLKLKKNEMIVYLQPNEYQSSIKELHLVVDKKNFIVQTILVIDHNLSWNLFHLHNWNFEPKLHESIFKFIIKEGIEVIK